VFYPRDTELLDRLGRARVTVTTRGPRGRRLAYTVILPFSVYRGEG
jgi:hypothetical protein